MLITRIIAKNFKTYRELDLDLTVNEEQPIILIGGENGGGKTTLFQAIYYALYGLKVKDFEHFNKLQNAGERAKNEGNSSNKIELEIHFTGKVLHNDYKYIIKRLYTINAQNSPVEAVTLNLNGDVFQYGTATPHAERVKKEAEVNKIIKANLPQELSKYFLFDAMEAGNLLKDEYLNRVIKENIENVMGFNKYIQLGNATNILTQDYIAQGIEIEEERNQYKNLLEEKKKIEELIVATNTHYERALSYSLSQKEFYESAKEGKNLQANIKEQIQLVERKIEDILNRETLFIEQSERFLNDIEIQVFIPKLISIIQNEIELILAEKSQKNNNDFIEPEHITKISEKVIAFLKENNLIESELTNEQKGLLKEYIIKKSNQDNTKTDYDFIDKNDVTNLEQLLGWSSINQFNIIEQQKESLEKELATLPNLKIQLLDLRKSDVGGGDEIIQSFEVNELKIKEFKETIKNYKSDIEKLDAKIKKFDLSDEEVPNPKLELLKKLGPLFTKVSNALLINKKTRIEEAMKNDLNTTLVAYENQIDRVELSEDLSNLSFKIYHKAGNEIYLEELNAASKQIIIQVLLKSLHYFGDYNPPVMIDTVMGYLDESSRASLLENYFPKLSHQTILLSTDSEIRKHIDLEKIENFISKKITLVRDKENQLTEVVEGYFPN
ncbi:AAA family ATPase [Flavobacterium macrobrachii]|uniref:AAA family ATPase n=1 Tax=Flavobacterium macrobrachii TaxID=591204 RepID=A0ABS2CWN9_9FLAO|nr:AAA family ATPase [Flavobacterium macrobrachii]MBM6499370.1 AAA family ATPase [Flavobacterium macrobrachii]